MKNQPTAHIPMRNAWKWTSLCILFCLTQVVKVAAQSDCRYENFSNWDREHDELESAKTYSNNIEWTPRSSYRDSFERSKIEFDEVTIRVCIESATFDFTCQDGCQIEWQFGQVPYKETFTVDSVKSRQCFTLNPSNAQSGIYEDWLDDGQIYFGYRPKKNDNFFDVRISFDFIPDTIASWEFDFEPAMEIETGLGAGMLYDSVCQIDPGLTLLEWIAYPTAGLNPGDRGTWRLTPPVDTGFNTFGNYAEIVPNLVPPGDYYVEYTYSNPYCDPNPTIGDSFKILASPSADLEDYFLPCRVPGSVFDLYFMTGPDNAFGGKFVVNGDTVTMGRNNSEILIPDRDTCYDVEYFAPDAHPDCTIGTPTDIATLRVDPFPDPSIVTDPIDKAICQDGGSVSYTFTRTSTGINPILDTNGVQVPWNVIPNERATIQLPAPDDPDGYRYEICLTEDRNYPEMGCGLTFNDTICTRTTCFEIVVYNDGVECAVNRPSGFVPDCIPFTNSNDPCPITTSPSLSLACSGLKLEFFEILEADIDAPGVTFCDENTIEFSWDGSLIGDFDTDGITGSSLGDYIPGALCFLIEFEICTPKIPVVGKLCWDPIPLDFGGIDDSDLCDQSLADYVVDGLNRSLGGDGGGGIIVVDRDGDGAFDQVVEEYDFIERGTSTVDIKVTENNGNIIIRNVVGWPKKPTDVCGGVPVQGTDLLDMIPIGSIPIIGPPIEDALAAAGCNAPISFSDEKTVQIPVINSNTPLFANCPGGDLTFAEDLSCDVEANWSIPVAFDGCYGDVLAYRGRTDSADVTFYNKGPVPPPVMITEQGIYQISGPIPGSELPVDTYLVEYAAFSCYGIADTCAFNIIVTAGDPVLRCPRDITLRTDVDECQVIATGLFPLGGIGCQSLINLEIDYPTASGFSDIVIDLPYIEANKGLVHDASGYAFPYGVTTVTYIMLVDINGDGDVDDPNERQECTFTVTVTDAQKPDPICLDVEVMLDNTGMIEVFAVDQMDGSAYIDGGSTDNCDTDPLIEIQRPGGDWGESVVFECGDVGTNFVNLRVTDADGNVAMCMAHVSVRDFFEGVQIEMDLPELCLEANNPVQLDFSNYVNIVLPNGQTIRHQDVDGNPYLGDAIGGFGISAFLPHPNSPADSLNAAGNITEDGIYTPGTGTGYVVVSYLMTLPNAFRPPNGNVAQAECFIIQHTTFELRQPLDMGDPFCDCTENEFREVVLGAATGGLEPYRIQYSGATLDIDGDGTADDFDGEYTYDQVNGHDVDDFTEDLGILNVEFTQPVWSLTVVDARGCVISRAGSCDSDDLTEAPEVICPPDIDSLFTETYDCHNQFTWLHPLPTDNCKPIIYDYQIVNPDGSIEGPFDLVNLLNIAPGAPLDERFEAEYEFEKGVSRVQYYVEDAVGLWDTCSFTVTVYDDDPPVWQNCPRLPIVENAETGHCDAYINFSAPYAIDNCSDTVIYTQIDQTGLNSGDRFPVGTTILIFTAEDQCGNIDTCEYKVIVNDYWESPIVECVDSVYQINDLDECGAIVNSLAPVVEDSCAAGISITYVIEDENGDTIKVGTNDASGSFFPVGLNELTYCVSDQPLMLITEVTQQLRSGTLPEDKVIGPTGIEPAFISQDSIFGDYLEVTNFGPAAMDVSCMQLSVCVDTGVLCTYVVPNLTVIPVGEVLTLRIGSGVDDTTSLFFHMGCEEADIDEPRGYVLSLYNRVLDVVTTNGFDPVGCGDIAIVEESDWIGVSQEHACSGSYYREDIIDHNTPPDWIKSSSCDSATIGTLNPSLEDFVNPWNGDTVSLQSVAPGKTVCSIPVLIEDVEDPTCVEYDTILYNMGTNLGNPINCGDCFESVITVPTDLLIGDINVFNLMGTSEDVNALDVTLISPEGTEIVLFSGACSPGDQDFNINLDDDGLSQDFAGCNPFGGGGLYRPVEELKELYRENMMGDWILQVANNSCEENLSIVDNWELEIMGILPYSQGDTILPNDTTLCSAEFCWIHPILEDNCCEGTIDVEYQVISPPDLRVPFGGRIIQGASVCETFDVGRTLVLYTLTDQYGNTSQCSFEVEVDDVEKPTILNCPGDLSERLGCGECEVAWYYPYRADDNCFVDTIIVDPPNGSYLPIGDTVICVIALDSTGNADTCKYTLSVLEYQPTSNELSCVDDINLSLDASCTAVLNADMILEGCNHRCYDNYILEVTEGCHGGGVPGPAHSDTFNLDDVGKCFTVTVIDPVSGNSCWGCVCIEEKLFPQIQCPPDDTISCIESLDPIDRGFATQLTCSPSADITYIDSLVDYGDCQNFRVQLYRIWTITDARGNKSRCTQTISVRQFDLADVVFPRNYDNLDLPALECDKFETNKDISGHIIDAPFCVDGYLLDSSVWRATGGDPTIMDPDARDLSGDRVPKVRGWNTIDSGPGKGYPSPFPVYYDQHPQWRTFGACWGPEDRVQWSGTGFPTLAGHSVLGDLGYCDLSVIYQDEEYEACEDGYTLLRYWKVQDECAPPVFGINPRVHIQRIKVLDKTGPEITYPDEVIVGTDAWNCHSFWDVPEPWLEDNCSSDLSYRVIVRSGRALETSPGGPWLVEGLKPGVHRVTIEASDGCGNTSEHDVTVTVVDDTPPVAICKDRLQVSLAGNQSPGSNYVSVCAEDLDKASYDNCTNWLWYKMIRQDELLGTVNGSFADNVVGCGGVNGDDDALVDGNQVYFDDCAKFCCEDAQDSVVLVVMRVHDVDPGAGPVNPLRYTPPTGDLVNHFTDCWVELEIVDKAQPLVVAPPDMVVSCMFWFDDSEDALSDVNNPTFGRVVTDLANREKVKTVDVVCEEWCEDHPKYGYEPSRDRPSIWNQACDFYNLYYDAAHPDDKYELVWGFDGYVTRTCGVQPTIRVDDRRGCGQGVINRDVIVTYQDPKTGGVVTFRDRQEIWVIDCDPFYATEDCFDDEDCIEWPLFCQQPDPIDGCGADLDPYSNPDLGYPVIENGCDDNCALIVVDYEDEELILEPDACFKVIRTWTVIDWCQYDPLVARNDDGDNPNEVSAGRWEFVQVINVRDKIDPNVEIVVGDFCQPAQKDSNGVCLGYIEICGIATDDCSPDDWISYDYKIDAFSDGVGQFGDFDFYVGKLTPKQFNDGTVLSQGPLDCQTYNQSGYCNPYAADPTQPFCASGDYPVGTHTIYWFAEDGCGNVVKETQQFEVLDCKNPTPYCKPGIVTVLMPVNGEICIWASDLDDGSFDNCTDTSDLKFYFNGDSSWTSYCINCDSFAARMVNEVLRVEVEVWVEDEEGNADFCVTTMEVQDNQDICPNNGIMANITGLISTHRDQNVADVHVDLMQGGVYMMEQISEVTGEYTFTNVEMYKPYEVYPRLDTLPLNGVSTRDLVIIQRHLLGITEISSPYDLIAADVNNNQSVSSADVSSLRRLILGRIDDFSQWNQSSWRFVDKDFTFTDVTSPWPFAESRLYPDLSKNEYDEDFVGIKIGDVSGDVAANAKESNRTRNVDEFTFVYPEMADWEEFGLLQLYPSEDIVLSGYQMELALDLEKVRFIGVLDDEALGLSDANWHYVEEGETGRLRVSYNTPRSPTKLTEEDVILSIQLESLKGEDDIDDAIELARDFTAEVYDDGLNGFDLRLNKKGESTDQQFKLYQNMPNPFGDFTIIGFDLPEDMATTLTVYDTYGRVVLVKKLNGKRGYNSVKLSKNYFGSSGVYFYQLDAEEYTKTKKMELQN